MKKSVTSQNIKPVSRISYKTEWRIPKVTCKYQEFYFSDAQNHLKAHY